MNTFTIGQVAERSGFSPSALRYYEQQGLVHPIDRTPAGYRLYDEMSLARLQFVARAKGLGCTLEEIAELAELWEHDDCGPVQRRLHELVTTKIADAKGRSDELTKLITELHTAAAHLGGQPLDGQCSDQCACANAAPAAAELTGNRASEHTDGAVACGLPADAMQARIEEWQDLFEFVTDREALPVGPGIRLTLRPETPLHELARLALAERSCCEFFAFAITIDERGIGLEARAPAEAAELVETVFGTAQA